MIVYRVEGLDTLGPYHTKASNKYMFQGELLSTCKILNRLGRYTDLYMDVYEKFPIHPEISREECTRHGMYVSDDIRNVKFGFETPSSLLSYFFLDDFKKIMDSGFFQVVMYEVPDEYVSVYSRQVVFMEEKATLISRTRFSKFVETHKKYDFTIKIDLLAGNIDCLPELLEEVLLYDDKNFDLSDLSKEDFELYRDMFSIDSQNFD